MYHLVPVNNGELDINYQDLISAIEVSDTHYIVNLQDSAEIRDSWIAQTELDWEKYATKPKSLNEIKQEKIQELEQSYYASFITFQSTALGTINTYPADTEAFNNLKDYEQRMIANPNKNSFFFKTLEAGTLVEHTRAQILQVMDDAEFFKVKQTQKLDGLVSQVKDPATDTPEKVNAITW